MLKSILKFSVFVLSLFNCFSADAQRLAIQTNATEWLIMSPNLGIEARLSRRITAGVGLSVCPFEKVPFISNLKLNNFRANGVIKYWFNRPMARNYVGLAAMGGYYNLRVNKTFLEGNAASFGATYGYALVLSKHWNVDFSIGVGLCRTWGKKYYLGDKKPYYNNDGRWIPFPLNTGISFAYIF